MMVLQERTPIQDSALFGIYSGERLKSNDVKECPLAVPDLVFLLI